ncbi:Longin-like protein [Hirsutella rhossiliensis]|uniref:Longin-like protein n=1 Tax=Hirsutella rhossiliensis TaxID=111463 RepID=A0A9P8SD50_9HYPO|nr:Longin-like protein [Hirsutella rhossiliensis]KAH0958353.1 Longin-like protein [Hirsutella rhossiliensis]
MTTAIPSIACLGVIGRNNNPLHMSIFPSHDAATDTLAPLRSPLQFSLLLSSTIDVFDLRARHSSSSNNNGDGGGAQQPLAGVAGLVTGDAGLLHAIDDRLAAYGFETNTGVRMVCVVDMRGRSAAVADAAAAAAAAASSGSAPATRPSGAGLRDAELKPVFRAMQTAYVRLLQNPFFDPDEHAPLGGRGGRSISSKRFVEDMRRIGEAWTPG